MDVVEVITAFKQGGAGNCVSIAVIKASIQVFGLDNVVLFQTTHTGSMTFQMKDGFEGILNTEELSIAQEGSRFECRSSSLIFDYASKCFAAMAKRLLVEKYLGVSSYNMAVAELNDGEHYRKGAYFLGLKQHSNTIGFKYVLNNRGIIGASKKHCFFCSNGIMDNYGTPKKIRGLNRIKYRFFSYISINP